MFKKMNDMVLEIREHMRGGQGSVEILNVYSQDELKGKCRLLARVTLEAGCSIGKHSHDQEEEIYYILSGNGVADDNGTLREVAAGDAIKTGGGEYHSIENTGSVPLVFMAIILLFA